MDGGVGRQKEHRRRECTGGMRGTEIRDDAALQQWEARYKHKSSLVQ